MRAPSSFHSTKARPSAATASPAVAAVLASIGCTGVNNPSVEAPRASGPSARAREATATRSPSSMAARRTRSGVDFEGNGDGVRHHPFQGSLPKIANDEIA